MSYVYNNHRNNYKDSYNRTNAHNKHQTAQYLWNNAHNENLKYQKDMLKNGFGDPNAKREMEMTLQQWSPKEMEANKYQIQSNQSFQNAIANEQAAIMDRNADYYENQISSKNNSDEMAAALKAQEIAAAERMNKVNANALGSMSQSLMSPGIKVPGVGGSGNMPNTSLYNRNGQRIGGTGAYFS